MLYKYQQETDLVHRALPEDSVSRQSHWLGMERGEPIIVIFDALLRYAKAYEKRHEQKLAEEAHLRDYFIQTLKGVYHFLDWNGAVALEMDRSTDSKDNGACDALFWHCVRAAGLKEEDLNL